jgi:peptide/nickel transport system substrate-binding protein
MDAEPRRGGTLTMVLAADPAGLDPIQLQGVHNWAEAIAVPAVFDQLFYPGADGRPHPKIGRDLLTEDAGLTWTLTLRPGVRFSDGTPFGAEAVRFNWARIADPANRAPAAGTAALVREMTVVDDVTLRLILHAPAHSFARRVARSLSSIGSPRAVQRLGVGFSTAPVGAGPFVLAEWARGSHLRFVRNPDYWQPGRPYADEVMVLTGIADAAGKFEALSRGLAQVALEPMGPQLARYRAEPERFELVTTADSGGGVALALNLSRPPFDDARVRRALALALDSAAFVQSAGYADPQMVMTTLDRRGARWCDAEIRLPSSDPAAAQRLLDGVIAEIGAPIRFTLETFANEGHVREAEAVKTLLESRLRGLTVEVRAGAVAEIAGKWRSGDFQACNYAVGWSDPALDLPAHFASSSPQNITRYARVEVDAALARLAAASDDAAVAEAHRDALRHVLADLPVVWLAHKEAFHVLDRRRLRDWKLFYSLRPLIEEAWLADA